MHNSGTSRPRRRLPAQYPHETPGLDKIKTFRDRSLNFSKLSVKVRKLLQENLRQKVRNL